MTEITVYNSSAGSGKTYNITKEYIKAILPNPYWIKSTLAITFTNKAAAEMKERIISALTDIVFKQDDEKCIEFTDELCVETGMDKKQIIEKSQIALKSILYRNKLTNGYSDFSVMTIDSFTNRMIKTFAFDLDVPVNYGVEMEFKGILMRLIDSLISSINENSVNENAKVLLYVFIEYLIYRIDEGEDWIIDKSIAETVKKLRGLENIHNETISINDEHITSNKLTKIIKEVREDIAVFENSVLSNVKICLEKAKTLSPENNIDMNIFKYTKASFLSPFVHLDNEPNYKNYIGLLKMRFFNIVDSEYSIDNIMNNEYLKSSNGNNPVIMEIIDCMRDINNLYSKYFENYINNRLIQKNIYENVIYRFVNNSIERYKKENSIIFIDEFDKAVSGLFKDNNNVPFVFFKMGEKFKSYFIDEFQDTSKMQWKNLSPLIDNALAESSNVVLVGDLKQAIYRWRGGETRIMKDEMQGGEVKNLSGNFRSKKNIIHFNNLLFPKVYENIYEENTIKQTFKMDDYPNEFSKNNGYINITHKEKKEHTETLLFDENNLEKIILDIEKRGYKRNDIGILVRKIAEGNKIGEYLSSLETPINFISASSIMMISDIFTDFIINTISYMINNNDMRAFYKLLFLWLKIINENENADIINDIAQNAENLKSNVIERNKMLNKYIPYINELMERMLSFKYQKTIYSIINDIIYYLLNKNNIDLSGSIPYIDKLRDIALDKDSQSLSVKEFLEYVDEKKEDISIATPDNDDAVRIITIHKAKGLQFPIVIIPFCNWDSIKNLRNNKTIVKTENRFIDKLAILFGDIEEGEVFNRYSNSNIALKNAERHNMHIDDINMLYVALTRAENELYIFSHFKTPKEKNTDDKMKNIIGRVFADIIPELIEDGEFTIEKKDNEYNLKIGNKTNNIKNDKQEDLFEINSINIADHNNDLYINRRIKPLFDSIGSNARKKGEMIHKILSYVEYKNTVKSAIKRALNEGLIGNDEKDTIENTINGLVNHPKVTFLYDTKNVLNEREIVYKGKTLRPDRVILDNKNAIIVDYKTGEYNEKDKKQVCEYIRVYNEMGYKVKGYILYIKSEPLLVEVDYE